MDQPISCVNHDDWWQRLEKHGLVAGNMLTNNVEADLSPRAMCAVVGIASHKHL